MATDIDVMNLIHTEEERRAQPKQPAGNRRPLFLFFKPGHRALVRPLYNLPQAVVLMKHDKYSPERSGRVNSICAAEEGKPCFYCLKVGNDKKLAAKKMLYVPVYVYGVVDSSGVAVTYEEHVEGSEEKVTKPVKGVRVLELKLSGTEFAILSQFNNIAKDAEYNHTITGCDFTITQSGSGQDKSFTATPKPPKAMPPQMSALIPDREHLRKLILEALPPFIADGNTGGGAPGSMDISTELDVDDPVF